MRIRKAYLTVPHEKGEISFQYPAFYGTDAGVINQIDREGLKRPNSSEIVSLIYDAWKNKEDKYSQEIIKILRYYCLLEGTGELYLPKSKGKEIHNGVILDLDPKNLKFSEEGKLIMDKNSLIKRLQSNDPLVKFVPDGYKTGPQNLSEFKKNPYIIARYGEEDAEKIAEIASEYKGNPALSSSAHRKNRVSLSSAIYDFRGDLGVNNPEALCIGYIDWFNKERCYGFGICEPR